MKRRGRAPNVISYSSAISACEKGGQWMQALQLYDVMTDAQLEVGETPNKELGFEEQNATARELNRSVIESQMNSYKWIS